eukprot:scaffold196082_cov17-Tisochrysis_lutea.AAC.1
MLEKLREFLDWARPLNLKRVLLEPLLQCASASVRLLSSFEQLPRAAWRKIAEHAVHSLFPEIPAGDGVNTSLTVSLLERLCSMWSQESSAGQAAAADGLLQEHARELAVPTIKCCLVCSKLLLLQPAQRTGEMPWFYSPFMPGVQGREWVAVCSSCSITYEIEGYQRTACVGKAEVRCQKKAMW